MSASTRDRRATIYPYLGHSEGGFTRSSYGEARGTYWCRVSPGPGQESMLDAQSGISAAAVMEFADEVPVEEHDLIVLDDDVQWKAGPITPRRAQRALVLRVERSQEMVELPIDQAAAAAAATYTDGSHANDEFASPVDQTIDGGGASTAEFEESFDGGGA